MIADGTSIRCGPFLRDFTVPNSSFALTSCLCLFNLLPCRQKGVEARTQLLKNALQLTVASYNSPGWGRRSLIAPLRSRPSRHGRRVAAQKVRVTVKREVLRDMFLLQMSESLPSVRTRYENPTTPPPRGKQIPRQWSKRHHLQMGWCPMAVSVSQDRFSLYDEVPYCFSHRARASKSYFHSDGISESNRHLRTTASPRPAFPAPTLKNSHPKSRQNPHRPCQ